MVREIFILVISVFFISNGYSDTTRVLFIGNSYTYANDLPSLFTHLSASGNKNVVTDMSAPGGYSFELHKSDSVTLSKIRPGIWDYVVLQEQSQTPVIEFLRYNSMYPSAIWLDSLINACNANTAFFMTWGRKYGGQQCIGPYCSPVFTDFFHMQDSLKSSYSMISDSLGSLLIPVGEAWRIARILNPLIDLWESDDSHPTLKGSYLAACVFYIKIFNLNPVGLSYTGGLTQSEALFLQQAAWQTFTGVRKISENIPGKFSLEQNYPNPFNSSTKIKFSITSNTRTQSRSGTSDVFSLSKVKDSPGRGGEGVALLTIYDILGKEIITLINEKLQPGTYEVTFNAVDLPSGIYFYTLSAENYRLTRKLILLK